MKKLEEKRTSNGALRLAFEEETGIALLTLEMEGRANKIDDNFAYGLSEAFDWALGHSELKGVILGTGHRDFCVGADLDWLYCERDPLLLYENVMKLQRFFRKMETSGVPVVAALTGSALGGGFEVALAAHHRIALEASHVKFGLPEVTLGVLPGAGGTQRLSRMLGIQKALDLILQGKILRAAKAHKVGLVDELAQTKEEVYRKARAWIAENPHPKRPWDRKNFRFPDVQPDSSEARDIFMGAAALVAQKTAWAYEAPQLAINAMQEGVRLHFDRALEVETSYFVKLATGDQAKNMLRTLWFHRTAAEKLEDLPKVEDAKIGKVGILGAGMMGAGLAFVCAQSGYEVILQDISQEALDRAMERIQHLVTKKRHLDEEARQALLKAIRPTLQAEDVAEVDLIIEAVIEDLAIKRNVHQKLAPLLAKEALWASNTSAIPISKLAVNSGRRANFLGLHFFSPVEKMALVEVIVTPETSEEALGRALAFVRKLKKIPIVVNDGYGFYTTRVFAAYILEAAQLVAEGHEPELIEWAARSAGMAVPPLQVFDEINLSLAQHVLAQREESSTYALPSEGIELIAKMVDLGRTGRSAGKGFYNYEGGRRIGFWKGLGDLVDGEAPQQDVEEIQRRLMFVQCVEVARTLDEGILRHERDAEVGAVFGLGFAPNSGGPLAYMDRLGPLKLVPTLKRMSQKYGPRYEPPALLNKMASQRRFFFDDCSKK